MEQALSRAVRAYHALQEAENDLYSLFKGHEAIEEIDEKLYDDIRDLVFIACDAVDGCPLSDEDNAEIEDIWQSFVEDGGGPRVRETKKARAAKGMG